MDNWPLCLAVLAAGIAIGGSLGAWFGYWSGRSVDTERRLRELEE